ncbi:MAG: NAD(+) diphosphatase [Dechloromonas sp.]|nr:NAD(+) diphosphatase [Dechloromonas sp.]
MNLASYWILRCEHRLLTIGGGDPIFPAGQAKDFGHPTKALHIGELNGLPCYAADVTQFPKLAESEAVPLRAIFSLAGQEVFALAGRATQLLDWQANHRFCGKCGTPTAMKAGEFAMACPACGLLAYPRISPAVMVLVRDGDKLLLGRSPHFKPGVFSALAGFLEPGETLEECAIREVREEVGVEIANLRYFRCQPWPFPNSLMVAFFADYAGGTITPDPSEIEEAGWFTPDALPILPEPISISRQLIDAALQGD